MTIGIGYESQGLYYIQPTSSIICAIAKSLGLLHCCLGHPNIEKFCKMVPNLSTLKSLKCDSCQLGKHVRSSFPNRTQNKVDSLFFVIHFDIWDPSYVSSTLGFQYFVTFIDNYSRCTRLYLMKDHFELFSIFKSFCFKI